VRVGAPAPGPAGAPTLPLVRFLQIQHDHTNLLGAFEGPLAAAGTIDLWRTWEDPAPASARDYDGIVLMGGVMMPDEDDDHPWIPREVELLQEGLEHEVPMLGVCFGSQVLARAAGAPVGPARASEIGWNDIGLLPAGGEDRLLGPLGTGYRAFQWHHYNFSWPEGAVRLAETAASNQAYRLGPVAWGLQFHIEVNRPTTDWWLDVGRYDIDAHGVDYDLFAADTDALVDANAEVAAALAGRFVDISRERRG